MTAAASLGGAISGAWLGQTIARSSDKSRSRSRDVALLNALMVEVEHSARLAGTYCDDRYKSPLYRLHHKVYDAAMPILAGSCLTGDDVFALIGFQSHVE